MSPSILTSIFSSDALLGCVYLAIAVIVSVRLLQVNLVLERDGPTLGISTAIAAYKSYEEASKSSAWKMRAAFDTGLRKAGSTRRIANEIGYAEKLETLEGAIEVNALVSSAIYRLAMENGEASAKRKERRDASVYSVPRYAVVGVEDHAKVREALKHFVRDWSEEGRRERSQGFGMVLDALQRLESEVDERRNKRVLVPGAGLGRLAWEISQLGSSPPRLRPLRPQGLKFRC